jgi:UDP-perosamine 4-acetyltransferase
VGDFAFIGAGATVLPRLKIGRGAVIGAGAVVTKDVPAGSTVAGNPARQLRP